MADPDANATYTPAEAAEKLGVSVADVESYVEEGLVTEARAEDGSLVISRAQMRRLWSVVTLHRDLGINLAGVAAVLQLREQFEQMRRDLELLIEIVERELGEDVWDRLWPEGRPRPAANVAAEPAQGTPSVRDAPPEAPPSDGSGDVSQGAEQEPDA